MIASIKYRINNFTDVLINLRINEASQIDYNTFVKRYEHAYNELSKLITQFDAIRQYSPTMYEVFDLANEYIKKLREYSTSFLGLEKTKDEDILGYTDLLLRIEHFIIDFGVLLRKLRREI